MVQNIPLAIILTVSAGLASTIGGAVVFCKPLVQAASERFLACSLGISAGVMLYVSFAELLVESTYEFSLEYSDQGTPVFLSTLCFFIGVLAMGGVNTLVHKLQGQHSHDAALSLAQLSRTQPQSEQESLFVVDNEAVHACATDPFGPNSEGALTEDATSGIVVVDGASCGGDDALDAEMGSAHGHQEHDAELATTKAAVQCEPVALTATEPECPSPVNGEEPKSTLEASVVTPADVAVHVGLHTGNKHPKKLARTGLITALAIALHNLPEGLTTFVAAVHDPAVGLALAIAIAIHNIPEGICVAVPMYFASGNRWKAFLWSLLAAASEPLGALIGLLILLQAPETSDGNLSGFVVGVLFGLIAGMMVFICVYELIPTALRYDPANKVTGTSIVAGMGVMALSLVLFEL